MDSQYRLTRWDRFLIFFLLLSSVASLFGLRAWVSSASTGQAIVRIAGKQVAALELDRPGEKVVRSGADGWCRVETKPGAVRVAASNCPKKICIATGWVSEASRSIVCAPHRMIVRIGGEAADREPAVDAVNR